MLNTLAGTLGFEACFRRAEETPFLLGEVSDAGGGTAAEWAASGWLPMVWEPALVKSGIYPHMRFSAMKTKIFDSSVSARCLDTGSFSVFVLQRQQRTRPARATDIARHDR